MNIYSKILITILPLVFCLVLSTVGTTYYFSRSALTELAENWLETRLSEAVKVVAGQQAMLSKYGLERIPASILKAQLDAHRIMSAIAVGDTGAIFAIDADGVITSHPDAEMVGKNVSQELWFKKLKPGRGHLVHPSNHGPCLAVVDYFEPWDWYLFASDPESEIYAVARRMTPYLTGLGIAGFFVMAGALMLLAKGLTRPVRELTRGAEKIGKGALDTHIHIDSRDEFGRLANVFNQMTAALQKTMMQLQQSSQRLEERVAQRTAALNDTNRRLRLEIEEREQMTREKEKLQNQLLQSQKMEAIGTLAGGIAHDFNNLLMGIQGNAEMLALELGGSGNLARRLNTIRDCVQSGTQLTQQLLGFARLGKYEVTATDPNELIEKCTAMFGRTRQELRIVTRYQKAVWAVNVDRGQIEQVLLNLLINAWQAMPEGGTVTIETANVSLPAEAVSAHQVAPGKYVQIVIADNGVGMAQDTMERIFDPFFTTKPIKRGTGLGLASVYGIVRNHGGFIEVNSKPGQGATFTLHLKALDASLPLQLLSEPPLTLGKGNILVVDDDAMIVDVARSMLGELGYEVLTAQSGQAALDLYAQHHKMIDLVILDMIMPDMGGGRTFDALKQINPAIKVLLASGYSISGQASDILKRGCSGFIQKPFDLQALSQKVRSVIEASGDPNDRPGGP